MMWVWEVLVNLILGISAVFSSVALLVFLLKLSLLIRFCKDVGQF
jgi:hypothetical protein